MLPGLKYLSLLAALLTGCGYVNYADTKAGEFKGNLFVMWVGEGGDSGDGKFVYVPNPRDPLRLIRKAPGASVRVIQPEMMYTDGASIPKVGQVFKGFSPWGYAPAYMVHDWLFVARQCLNDNMATAKESVIRDMEFNESARIMAEAIKALIEAGTVARNDVAPSVISSVVAGPISRQRWTVKGACLTPRVSKEDRAAATAAIPGASLKALRGQFRTLPDGTRMPLAPARLVGSVSF